MKQRVDPPRGPKPAGPYSSAIKANGFVFVSGQIPQRPESGELVRGSIEEQVKQVLENIKLVLEGAGSSLEKVVRCTVYMRDLKNFGAMNEVYAKYFAGSAPPSRTTIQAAELPKSVDVEMDAIAIE